MGKVTQEARDAAAKLAEDVLSGWCHIGGNDIPAIRNGLWDDDHTDLGLLVKAFARFETETIARTNNHAELVDDRPDFVGDPICKIASYNECHETALELGYPSLTEALEHLSELKEAPPAPAELVEALREVKEAARIGQPGRPVPMKSKWVQLPSTVYHRVCAALSLYGGEK